MNPGHTLPLRDMRPGHFVLGAALALGLGTAAYLAASNWGAWFAQPEFVSAAPVECDLAAGPCTAVFGPERSISLAMTPHPLRAAEPIRVSVRGTGIEARQARITFSGVEMNMGMTTVELSDLGAGRFDGVATLPLCISRRMAWRARVSLSAPDAIHHADFPFETTRH